MKTNTCTIKQVLSDDGSIARIRQILEINPACTRNEIAGIVCDEFGFKDALGNAQLSASLKVLRDLDVKGTIKLPKPLFAHRKKWEPRRLGHPVDEPVNVPESVEKIEDLRLIVVESGDSDLMRIHNELICSEHPLGDKRVVGRQLRYLIKSEHGWLGAVTFGSCALYLQDRDSWIGWQGDDLVRNRNYVVNMSRFLIRNCVRCKNLASHVLAMCVKQLPADYETRFGYRPLVAETFVDTQSCAGTCYKAANWQLVGQTKGRGRNDTNTKYGKSVKDIYLYPLDARFREKMRLPEKQPLRIEAISPAEGIQSEKWAEREFGGARLGDRRLTSRLVKIAGNKSLYPGASYLEAAHGDRYDIKAYCNFIRNERETINFNAILLPHAERTRQRMKGADCVLVIQDTTELNYSNLKSCAGLGTTGESRNGFDVTGLKLHSSFVVDGQGLPLGILGAKCYAPDHSKVKKKKSETRNTPISQKESFRWLEGYELCVEASRLMPETRIVNVMDREADMYELFELAEKNENRVDLIVRAKHDRLLVDGDAKLFERLRRAPVRFELEVDIPPQRARNKKQGKKERPYMPARKARLEVRYENVCLKPPESPILKNRKAIRLRAVYAREENPPEGAEQISWFLLTTLKVSDDGTAKEVVEFYRRRWRIEEWHRVLKTGLNIEEYQNRTAERIKRRLAIDMAIGWRAMFLTTTGRQNPGAPAELFFDAKECAIISSLAGKKKTTVGDAVTEIAKLGGYQGRGSEGPPGFESVRRGLVSLMHMVRGYEIALSGPP